MAAVPRCERHGPKTPYKNGNGRTTYRCTPCRREYNHANGHHPPRRERVYAPAARRCARGHDLTPYGTKGHYRCLTCKRERDAANRLLKIKRDREQHKLDARKKMLRREIAAELQRRGVPIPRSNADLLHRRPYASMSKPASGRPTVSPPDKGASSPITRSPTKASSPSYR